MKGRTFRPNGSLMCFFKPMKMPYLIRKYVLYKFVKLLFTLTFHPFKGCKDKLSCTFKRDVKPNKCHI